MYSYALFAYRVNWCILSAYVRSLSGLPGDLSQLPGLYINYGLYNYVLIYLYNAVFAFLRRFIIAVNKV